MPTGQVYVGPRGPTNARIMVVGEAPGLQEERFQQPFKGPSGMVLEEVLNAVGVNPSEVYFTNLCRYRPAANDIRTMFVEQKVPGIGKVGLPNDLVVAGLKELAAEIALVQPNIIIALGNYPMRLLTGKGSWNDGYTGIGSYRGYILPGVGPALGRKVLPTYHPSYILRSYPDKAIWKLDLGRAAKESHFPEIRTPRKRVIIDPRGPAREDWARWLRSPAGALSPPVNMGSEDAPDWQVHASDSFMSGDIEYIGSKLLCFGFTRNASIAVTFATYNEADIAFVRDVAECGVPLCFQNGMFDCSICEWHYGMKLFDKLKHDTMIAMHVSYTEFPKDLGFIGSIWTELPVWWDTFKWDDIKKGKTPVEACYEYNGYDVICTHEAMLAFMADELQDPAVAATYEFEMSLVRPLWDIGRKGVRIDTAAMEGLKSKLLAEATDLKAALMLMNGGKEMNPKSPPQVAKFLYETLGVPQKGKKTSGGAWSMDDDTLATLSLHAKTDQQRTAIKVIREVRERLDLVSKFCEIELDDDGRMRCHYDPAKTQTGRLASRKFYPTNRGANLQNVPRDDRVRSVFVADPGFTFGYADLKSAESLVVAHITGDSEMLRLHGPEFMTGEQDGHKYVASFLLGKPMDKLTKDERYLGKKTRHSANYGVGWLRFMQSVNAEAQKTGVSINAAQAKDLLLRYRQLHPGLEAWHRQVQAELYSTRTITTVPIEHILPNGETVWFSRPHIFYDRPDSILPEAIAQSPQGTVANVLNEGLLRVDRSKELTVDLDFQMILQVHDAIGFQLPTAFVNPALRRLRELMTVRLLITRKGIDPYEVTIPVDIKVGGNWGEFDPKKPDVNPNGLREWREEEFDG